jgi:hypothetical protein
MAPFTWEYVREVSFPARVPEDPDYSWPSSGWRERVWERFIGHEENKTTGDWILVSWSLASSRILVLGMLLLLLAPGSASAYGRSAEDLVGAFSLEKTIRLGSSSGCFATTSASDPLSPPAVVTDDQPPSLAGFDFEPRTVPASAPRAINFTLNTIDDQSGPGASAAYFQSPSGDQVSAAIFDAENLTSSGPEGNVYAARMLLPRGPETGNWELKNLTLTDKVGNRRVLQHTDLLRLGLPVELRVT